MQRVWAEPLAGGLKRFIALVRIRVRVRVRFGVRARLELFLLLSPPQARGNFEAAAWEAQAAGLRQGSPADP